MTVPAQPTPAKRETVREDVREELPGNGQAGQPNAEAPGSLRAAVLRVEGVTDVFPSRPLWQRLPAGALSLLQQAAGQRGAGDRSTGQQGGDPDDGPLVEARADGSATDVTVRIGVGADARTPDVVRAVAAAVRAHFAPAQVSVKVTVARISPE
ncbi:hypothetical protein [Pseudarthrobacter chlorophenolicus]|uniref:hypothetical protein n=1 Tax=Pseudarthrobacter chlorophenolicus TaxID=85085 RepID=UPI0005F2DBB4|nr:hypothetical protein [Pseudarthrobacter chlorophenolicus]